MLTNLQKKPIIFSEKIQSYLKNDLELGYEIMLHRAQEFSRD